LSGPPVGGEVRSAGPIGEPPPVIEGGGVNLRPPDPTDAGLLFPPTHGARATVWTYMAYGPWTDERAMSEWIASTVESEDPRWWTAEVEGARWAWPR
jgi:RimJ/RimL family protein N-acetyltransferase